MELGRIALKPDHDICDDCVKWLKENSRIDTRERESVMSSCEDARVELAGFIEEAA